MAFQVRLNQASGVPYYRQIADQIAFAVLNGLLSSGEKLPTVRQLAVDLQINLNTVIKAYKELEHKGVVDTQQGTGTFVTDRKGKSFPQEKETLLRSKCLYFIDELTAHGIAGKDALRIIQDIIKEREEKKNDSKRSP